MENKNFIKHSFYCHTGEYHKICEDYATVHEHGGAVSVALCDGAGSCENSVLGAETVAESVSEFFTVNFSELYNLPEEEIKNRTAEFIHNIITETALKYNISEYSLSTTLMCATLCNDGRYIWIHVGDGTISCGDKNGRFSLISQYCHKTAVNITDFVTSYNFPAVVGKGKNDISSFLLLTDGADMLIKTDGTLTETAYDIMNFATLYNKNHMKSEYKAIAEKIQIFGSADDISFAFICDKRTAPEIFRKLSPEQRRIAFDLKPAEKNIDSYVQLLKTLTEKNSISLRHVMQIMHTHNLTRTMKKIDPLIYSGVLTYKNGAISL